MAIIVTGTSARNSAATIYAPSETYHDPETLTLDNGPIGAATTRLPARRIASVALIAFGVNLLTSTLAPAAGLPFNQNDWPNPSRARSIISSVSSRPSAVADTPTYQTDWPNPFVTRVFRPVPPPNLLETTLASITGTPTSQNAWPNPTLARTFRITPPPNLLTTTLAPVVSASPFGQIDWPNPSLARRRVPPTSSNVLMEIVELPYGQASFPDRVQSRLPWLLVSVSSQPQTTPGTPTSQSEWPLPQRAIVVARLHPVPNLQGSTLAPATGAPFTPVTWPNPQPSRQQPAVGWTQDRKSYYQDIKPFTQVDWVTPSLLRTTRVDQVPNTLIGVLPTAAPFAPITWPNPAVKQRLVIDWTQDRKAYYQDIKPFAQVDWVTPLSWRTTRVDLIPNLLTNTLASTPLTKPFLQSEWVNPTPIRQQIAVGWSQDRKAYYQDNAAFNLTDWPTPLGPRSLRVLDAPNLLTGTLAPIAVPFNQSDWPTPLRLRSLLLFTDASNLLTSSLTVAPFRQTDWPTPLGPKRALFVVVPNATITLPAVPMVQYDWPLPRQLAVVNRGFTQDVARHLIGQDTFYAGPGRGPVYDYPNPRYKGRALDLLTWIQGRQFYYIEPPPGEPCEIIVAGSYQPIVTVTGSYQVTIDISGSYNPMIVIPGEHC